MKNNKFYAAVIMLLSVVAVGVLIFLSPVEEEEYEYYSATSEITGAFYSDNTVTSTSTPTVSESADKVNTTEAPQTLPVQTTTMTESMTKAPVRLEYGKGNTYFDDSAECKFIQIVTTERGIDSSLLVSIYSLPDEGLNYVLEFYPGERTADNLRRVYLIDVNGKIDSVAADKSEERENISAAENTVCMTILIRQGIFPCIGDLL